MKRRQGPTLEEAERLLQEAELPPDPRSLAAIKAARAGNLKKLAQTVADAYEARNDFRAAARAKESERLYNLVVYAGSGVDTGQSNRKKGVRDLLAAKAAAEAAAVAAEDVYLELASGS